MQRANTAVPGSAPQLLGRRSHRRARDGVPATELTMRSGRCNCATATPIWHSPRRWHIARADPWCDRCRPPPQPSSLPIDFLRHPAGALSGCDRRAHPDLAPPLEALVSETQGNRRALVHGDVSPKNILRGPDGPVFLDAECAWWGDPAFDLAFCLNHLLLKCLWTPAATAGFLGCFDAFAATIRGHVIWEPPAELEARAAHLLPGLFLARVDGKSPVEYVTTEPDKNRVSRTARALLLHPADTRRCAPGLERELAA